MNCKKQNNPKKFNVMKNSFKNYLFIATVFTVLFGFSAEKNGLENGLRVKESYVTFNDVKKGSLLQLKDVNDQIIYKEEINKSGYYSRKFDFTFLPQGKYFFELVKDLEISTKPLSVNANSVIFHNHVTNFFKPYVSLKGSKILISQLSLNKQPLKIKLFYENELGESDLIYTETLSGEVALKTVLKLSEKKKGTYTIIMFSENYMFEETLNLF